MPVTVWRVLFGALLLGHTAYLVQATANASLAQSGFVDAAGYRWAPGSSSAARAQQNARQALVFDVARMGVLLASLALVRRRNGWVAAALWTALVLAERSLVDTGAHFVPVPWHFLLVPAWLWSLRPPWQSPPWVVFVACALTLGTVLWRVPFGAAQDTMVIPPPPWQPIAAACALAPLLAAVGVFARRPAVALAGAAGLAFATMVMGPPFGLVPLVAAALTACAASRVTRFKIDS